MKTPEKRLWMKLTQAQIPPTFLFQREYMLRHDNVTNKKRKGICFHTGLGFVIEAMGCEHRPTVIVVVLTVHTNFLITSK